MTSEPLWKDKLRKYLGRVREEPQEMRKPVIVHRSTPEEKLKKIRRILTEMEGTLGHLNIDADQTTILRRALGDIDAALGPVNERMGRKGKEEG